MSPQPRLIYHSPPAATWLWRFRGQGLPSSPVMPIASLFEVRVSDCIEVEPPARAWSACLSMSATAARRSSAGFVLPSRTRPEINVGRLDRPRRWPNAQPGRPTHRRARNGHGRRALADEAQPGNPGTGGCRHGSFHVEVKYGFRAARVFFCQMPLERDHFKMKRSLH